MLPLTSMQRVGLLAILLPGLAMAQIPASTVSKSADTPTFSGFYVGLQSGYGASERIVKSFAHFEGLLGGIFMGGGYQFSNNIYVGLEGAFTLDSRKAQNYEAGIAQRSASSKKHWEGVVRLGHVWGKTMPYLLAGCRLTQGRLFVKTLAPGPTFEEVKVVKLNFFGVVAGVGVDHKILPNLSVGGRYTYAHLTDRLDGGPVRLTDHQALVRVTYHF